MDVAPEKTETSVRCTSLILWHPPVHNLEEWNSYTTQPNTVLRKCFSSTFHRPPKLRDKKYKKKKLFSFVLSFYFRFVVMTTHHYVYHFNYIRFEFAVCDKKYIFVDAHNIRIFEHLFVIGELFVYCWSNEISNFRSHAMLHIQFYTVNTIVYHSFEQWNVHFVLFGKFEYTGCWSKLLMVTWNEYFEYIGPSRRCMQLVKWCCWPARRMFRPHQLSHISNVFDFVIGKKFTGQYFYRTSLLQASRQLRSSNIFSNLCTDRWFYFNLDRS